MAHPGGETLNGEHQRNSALLEVALAAFHRREFETARRALEALFTFGAEQAATLFVYAICAAETGATDLAAEAFAHGEARQIATPTSPEPARDLEGLRVLARKWVGDGVHARSRIPSPTNGQLGWSSP
jgi:hypothetical protein